MTRVSNCADQSYIPVKMKEAVLFFAYENPVIAALECLVCKLHLEESCLSCREKGRAVEDCPVVRGTCEHTFHEHCIKSWCLQRGECPVCFNVWVPASYIQRS
ncbi:uncharacterized protein Tco025E_07174 [Trypanosoma conorhini]|uniref:RING-type domain-containing protein n=1 Tax=Trypanosoma conorhini TaxID=83891 RepID=A0A422NSG4_9TRYP|nr:uncharacterized protein Tco025E_07174 [Trypanosoma conorhini]RNF08425.1 hypothetical protein Tco025E_07174 [Trypanosoma conorhini]